MAHSLNNILLPTFLKTKVKFFKISFTILRMREARKRLYKQTSTNYIFAILCSIQTHSFALFSLTKDKHNKA